MSSHPVSHATHNAVSPARFVWLMSTSEAEDAVCSGSQRRDEALTGAQEAVDHFRLQVANGCEQWRRSANVVDDVSARTCCEKTLHDLKQDCSTFIVATKIKSLFARSSIITNVYRKNMKAAALLTLSSSL